MPNWISCGFNATSLLKPAAKLASSSPGKPAIKQVNKLVGTAAPASVIARVTTATVTAGAAAVLIS